MKPEFRIRLEKHLLPRIEQLTDRKQVKDDTEYLANLRIADNLREALEITNKG